MDRRRTLLLALAGLAAAPLNAFAQSDAPATAPATPAPPSDMGEAERKHIHDTLQVGTLSLETSRLAVGHASSAKVKQFATFEVAEQETIGGILKPMAGGPVAIDPAQAEIMRKLEQSGNRFDSDYVEAQLQGHQKLLAIQQTYLSAGKNPLNTDIAKLASAVIHEHITLLDELQKSGMRG